MNILVTGASQGIGCEIVKQFAQNPNNNIIAIARSQSKLEQLKNECITQYNNSIHTISIDVSSVDLSSKLQTQLNNYSNIDVLINNAGLLINKNITQITISEIQQLYNVNIIGVINLIKSLLDGNKLNNSHIVNIGSMGGYQGSAKYNGLSIYSSTKAALANLSECLAEELSHLKTKVNCLALGAVETEMLSKAFPEYQAPLKAVQIAQYITGFALTASQYYNGKVLPVSLSTP